MQRVPVPSAVVVLLLLAAGPVSAQRTSCIAVPRAGSEAIGSQGGAVMTFIRPMFECDNGRTMTADNANFSQVAGRIDLFGNVVVRDPERTLTSDRAVYISAQRRLEAIGNGVLTDLTTGSVIRGDLINLYQETPTRAQRVEATATSGIARAILRRAAEPGAPRDSTIIDANQIVLEGEESFRAIGNATMLRDSLRAFGHTIEYAERDSAMVIAGAARVELPNQELRGDSINATIGADEQVREVFTRHNASLVGTEMQVRAAAVRLMFENGAVTRMVAMNWRPVQGQPAAARPRVDAEEFRMESDSIDVTAPDGEITEAAAIGNAYGERVTPDSLRGRLPQVDRADSAMIANDWMRGDTVRAFFAANPEAARDTAAPSRIMERLMAAGSPAQSIYRMASENRPNDQLSVSYLSANRIEVQFANGVVSIVTAEGEARGVYVQPAGNARRTTGGGVPRP